VLTVEDLKKFPASQIVELVRPARADHPGEKDQKLTGVRLRDVLERAKPKVAGRGELKTMATVAGATHGYKVAFSWNEVFNTEVGASDATRADHLGEELKRLRNAGAQQPAAPAASATQNDPRERRQNIVSLPEGEQNRDRTVLVSRGCFLRCKD
jgi:hypothetical protein